MNAAMNFDEMQATLSSPGKNGLGIMNCNKTDLLNTILAALWRLDNYMQEYNDPFFADAYMELDEIRLDIQQGCLICDRSRNEIRLLIKSVEKHFSIEYN